MNTLLQCLYHNRIFRKCLFDWSREKEEVRMDVEEKGVKKPPEKEEDDPIFQLQVIFSHLNQGSERSFIPVGLAQSLKLAAHIQQDTTE